MIICHCASVNERQVQEALKLGFSWQEVVRLLGIGKNCGKCQDYMKNIATEPGQ